MHDNQVLARIAALKDAPVKQLKKLWNDLYKKPAPEFNRTYLVSRLTYRLQELAYGNEEHDLTEKRLAAMARKTRFKQGGRNESRKPQIHRPRKLIINEKEAAQVRSIFEGFLDLKSVTLLVKELRKEGVRTKSFITQKKKQRHGKLFDKNQVCGFEQFGAVSDLAQVSAPWTAELSNGNFMSISTTTGVRSLQGNGVTPKALNLGNYLSSGIIWTVPNIGTRYLGMGWFLPNLPAAEGNIIHFTATPPTALGGVDADGVRITVDNTGTVRIRQNSTNAVLVTSATYAVSANTQYWLSVSCNPNSGWVAFALNGTVICTATLGIIFPLQYISFSSAGVSSVGQNIVIDDLVSYSTDGADTASTLVPPRSVWTSLPNAIGDQTQWSRIGGAVANWASVDGQAYQTSTYNTTSQSGTFDYYNITDLPGAPTTIDGVVVTACARKEDSGSRNLKLHARVNGVDDTSSPLTLTTGAAFWYLSATFTTAPGGGAWTATDINLCQLGLESA